MKMKKMVLAVILAMFFLSSVTGCATIGKKRFSESDRQKAWTLMEWGNFYYKAKNYRKALVHYDRALRKCEMPQLYRKIAYCLYKLGKKSEARVVYKHALAVKNSGKIY